MMEPHAKSGMKVRLSPGDYVTLVESVDGELVAFKVRPAGYGDLAVLLKAGDSCIAVRCVATSLSITPMFFGRNGSQYRIGERYIREERESQSNSDLPEHYALDAAIPKFHEESNNRVGVVSENAQAGVQGSEAIERIQSTYHFINRVFSIGSIALLDSSDESSAFFYSFQRPLGFSGSSVISHHGSVSGFIGSGDASRFPDTISPWNSVLPAVVRFFDNPSVESLGDVCVAAGISNRIACYLFALNGVRRFASPQPQYLGSIGLSRVSDRAFASVTICPDPYLYNDNFKIPPDARYQFTARRIEEVEREIGIQPNDMIGRRVEQYFGLNVAGYLVPVVALSDSQRPPCEIDIQYSSTHPNALHVFDRAESFIVDNQVYLESFFCMPSGFDTIEYSYESAYYSNGSLIGSVSSDVTRPEILPQSGLDYTNTMHSKMQEFIANNPSIAFISRSSRELRRGVSASGGSYTTGNNTLQYHWLDLSAHNTLQRDPNPGGAVYGVNYFFMPYGFEPIRPNRRDIQNLAIFISTDEISDYYTPDDGFGLFRQDMEELQQEVNLFTGDSLKIVILDRASLVTPNSQDNTCPTVGTDAPGDPLPDVLPVVNLQENGTPTGDRYIEIFEQSANGRPINRLIVVLDSSGSMRNSVLYNPINTALDELIAYVEDEYPGIQTEVNNISNEAWAFNANYYISRAEPADNIVLISIINESTPYGPATAPDYGLFKSDIANLKNTLAAPPCVAASVVNIDVPSLWPDTGLSDTVAPFSDTTDGSDIDRPEYITIATELRLFGDIEINGQTYDRDSRWPPIIDEFGSSADYAYALYDTSRSARSAVDCEDDADRFISLMGSGNILSQSGRTKKAGFDDERWAKAAAAAVREINLINANA